MWKDYSRSYIKNNKASSLSVMVGVFIASLFLSFLCSLFYNLWLDQLAGIAAKGEWQGQVTEDMAPWRLLPLDFAVILAVCFAMVLVIHTSFAVSMNDRIHQFGIFSSIGATPRQIRTCLLQEAALLALPAILAGTFAGILLTIGAMKGVNVIGAEIAGTRRAVFHYHPAILAGTLLISGFTVLFSAWLPARKLSRLTPLEAVRGAKDLGLKKKKHSRILASVFGIEGELVGNALKAQKKALRTTSISLTLSFLGFMVMRSFFTLSQISTEHTYFERYQNVWDVMATVKNTRIEEFELTDRLKKLPGAESTVVYQKAEALAIVPKTEISEEVAALGGLEALAGTAVTEETLAGTAVTEETLVGTVVAEEAAFYRIQAPIVILDDESFLEYCEQIGTAPSLEGGILVNRIWDRIHSSFRYREYVPYLRGGSTVSVLEGIGGAEVNAEYKETAEEAADSSGTGTIQLPVSVNMEELPILADTEELPVLREEYDDYALVHIVPLSLWRQLGKNYGGVVSDLCIRVLADERTSPEALNELEAQVRGLLEGTYEIETENRIQEKQSNDEMIDAYEFILGAFCALFAMIGIANVFSNTWGFLRQRKREFVRYLSIGLTPEELRKIFCIEAITVAGKPFAVTLLLTVVLTGFMIKGSYLDPVEFIRRAPVLPVAVFALVIAAFVALAYWLGGRRVLRSSLMEALRDDTMI